MIKPGDRVQLMRVPPGVEAMHPEQDEMLHTKDVFRQCVGHVFRVRAVGTDTPYEDTENLELWVHRGVDCDNLAKAEVIWVEPDYVDVVTDMEPHL